MCGTLTTISQIRTMKNYITTILLTLGMATSLIAQNSISDREERARKVNAYYGQAVTAYNDGDLNAAREALKNALALNPRHAQSYALSLRLKQNKGSFKAKNRERAMTKIILPRIEIDDLPLGEALDILGKLIQKKTNDSFTPNFVIQDNTGILKKRKVNLNLQNIPASVVLDYLLEQSGATARFDNYAINIRSRRPIKASEAPQEKAFGEK